MSAGEQDAPAQEPIAAPDLDGATEWLNVAAPITMAALRGKVVLLDFWTYGCINCMHVLRDLKVLEQRFADELVVIGVHSPKFPNERSSDNLRRVLVRYEIEHPVANDAGHVIWRRYGVQAWPTRVIIDPAGNLVGTAMGEGNLDGFVSAIRTVIRVFDEKGAIDRTPLPLSLERAHHTDRPLLYPGKVLADAASGRLFIADSNHNRIVVASLGGQLIETVGSGIQSDADGIFSQARFNRPQGLALDAPGGILYVADTGNDQIRAVDLQVRAVHTLDLANLKSPWDVALKTGILLVAMAGPHQVWVVDLLHDRAYPYAGSGEEARRDGTVSAAAFAQPSGLAIDGNTLYVADAESNTIRAVRLPPENVVTTLTRGDLFDFSELQHPLGVAVHDGRVFIADTYHHQIKVLDPASGRVAPYAGTGSPGHADGEASRAEFHEPGGLSAANNTLFVADTNNHAIRAIDLRSAVVSTLAIEGLAPPTSWSYLRRR
jgi:DNA-binding beta-propeller fold protein YncE